MRQVVDNDNDFGSKLVVREQQYERKAKDKERGDMESYDAEEDDTTFEEHHHFHQPEATHQHHPSCQNIDDALGSLYSLPYSEIVEHNNGYKVNFDYDWFIDGEPEVFSFCVEQQLEEKEQTESMPFLRKQSISGDEALDCVLAGMELESLSQEECSELYTPQPQDKILSVGVDEYLNSSSIEIKTFDEELSQASELSDAAIFSSPENHASLATDNHYDGIIPNFLPFEDPSTPEGAFFRSIQMERDLLFKTIHTDSDDDEDLSGVFFLQHSDPALQYLYEAPWDDVIDLDADGSKMETFLLSSLSFLDAASKSLRNSLLTEIKKKEKMITHELNVVQSINWDIATSLSYARQVSSYIHHVKCHEEDGMGGSEIIVCHANQRNQLYQIDMLLHDIEEIVRNEAAVFSFCDSFAASITTQGDCMISLFETCQLLKKRLLFDERFRYLTCLEKSRERVSRIFGYIRKKIEEELILFLFRRCCNPDFDPDEWNNDRLSEYISLLNACLCVNDFWARECIENKSNGLPAHECEIEPTAIQWTTRISEAFCFEAERCLAKALLEPSIISSDSSNKSLFDDNIREMKSELCDIQVFSENAATLRKIVKNLISIRFEFENEKDMLPKIFHSLCLNLASVMYSFDLFMSWHQSPSNYELLRCDSSANEEICPRVEVEKIDVVKDDDTKSTTSSNFSNSSFCSQKQTIAIFLKGHEYSGVLKLKDLKATNDIYNLLYKERKKIWEECCVVINKVLEAAVDTVHESDTNSEFSSWSQELQSLHCIYRLCEQMDSFAKKFLSGYEYDRYLLNARTPPDTNYSSAAPSLICLLTSFLHKTHVESMTEVGTMMSTENWDLLPIKLNDGTLSGNLIEDSVQTFLKSPELTQSCSGSDTTVSSLWKNQFLLKCQSGFSFSLKNGNPFVPTDSIDKTSSNINLQTLDSLTCGMGCRYTDMKRELYEELLGYTTETDTKELVIGTKSSLRALAGWTMRLIQIQQYLPIVEDKVSQVMCNLYDLYFLTIFRICCGSSQSESVILGSATRSDFAFNERFPLDLQPNKKQAKSVGATHSSSRRTNVLVTNSCSDDINAPLLCEKSIASNLEKFIRRGQLELSTMVRLDQIEKWQFVGTKGNQIECPDYTVTCLEKRLAAASSCLFAACLLNVSIGQMNLLCETNIICRYHFSLMDIVIHMKKTMFRIAATRAIGAQSIVSNVSLRYRFDSNISIIF